MQLGILQSTIEIAEAIKHILYAGALPNPIKLKVSINFNYNEGN